MLQTDEWKVTLAMDSDTVLMNIDLRLYTLVLGKQTCLCINNNNYHEI